MKINKNNKTIILMLFLSLIIFVNCLFAAESRTDELVKNLDEINFPQYTVIERPVVAYSGDNLKDPFLTTLPSDLGSAVGNKEEEKLPDLVIQGVILGPRFPQVIINNKVLKIGDQISDTTVKAISKDEVSVLFNDKYYNLVAPMVIVKTSQIPGGKK